MTIVETNLERWGNMSDQEATEMLSSGQSPWEYSWPIGVWCWDEQSNQVLVGTCPDDAEILTYADAREQFS